MEVSRSETLTDPVPENCLIGMSNCTGGGGGEGVCDNRDHQRHWQTNGQRAGQAKGQSIYGL